MTTRRSLNTLAYVVILALIAACLIALSVVSIGSDGATGEYATLTSAAGEFHAWLTAVSTPAP